MTEQIKNVPLTIIDGIPNFEQIDNDSNEPQLTREELERLGQYVDVSRLIDEQENNKQSGNEQANRVEQTAYAIEEVSQTEFVPGLALRKEIGLQLDSIEFPSSLQKGLTPEERDKLLNQLNDYMSRCFLEMQELAPYDLTGEVDNFEALKKISASFYRTVDHISKLIKEGKESPDWDWPKLPWPFNLEKRKIPDDQYLRTINKDNLNELKKYLKAVKNLIEYEERPKHEELLIAEKYRQLKNPPSKTDFISNYSRTKNNFLSELKARYAEITAVVKSCSKERYDPNTPADKMSLGIAHSLYELRGPLGCGTDSVFPKVLKACFKCVEKMLNNRVEELIFQIKGFEEETKLLTEVPADIMADKIKMLDNKQKLLAARKLIPKDALTRAEKIRTLAPALFNEPTSQKN